MPSKAEKLLEQMRNSKSNWKRADLDKLYEEFGFVISHGGSHDIVKHPDFPLLRTSLPRHRVLAKGYVEFAVKLVDRLLELQKESEG
ncbi:MAG: type II toxin-antitoxin system HicA family toxin [Anaerolineales bacterium]|nr:type II toxin-antitoxin system HicA family toxin [Anaerolineales bacterium]